MVKIVKILFRPSLSGKKLNSKKNASLGKKLNWKKKAVAPVRRSLMSMLPDAAAIISQKFREPVVFQVGKVFADRARKFAANLKDVIARWRLVDAGHLLGRVTKHTPDAQDVQDVLRATDVVLTNHFVPASAWTGYVNERKKAEAGLTCGGCDFRPAISVLWRLPPLWPTPRLSSAEKCRSWPASVPRCK